MSGVRAGLIGCGGMGRNHLQAMLALDGVEVVALADPRREALAAAGELAPAATGHATAAGLLAESPDLVCVATNGPSHAELTIAAAEAGARWIMGEKPMATCLADARAMIDACAEHGCRLAINHTRRWWSAYHRLRDALADGVIGPVGGVFYSLGAGRMGCNGTHAVDLVRLMVGSELTGVTAWLDTTGTPDPRGPQFRDPGGHAVFHFANGARMYLDQMEDLGVPPRLEIVGAVGRVAVEDLRGHWEVRARRAEDRDKGMGSYGCPLEPVPFDVSDCPTISSWPVVQREAYRNLMSDEPVACSGEDGYRAIEAILAAHLSDARGHRPVALPLTGDDLRFTVEFT